ncbi:unnamed protein product [Eruca vesicaria subsp. sativa]|uniref:F-box associated beta-propeller type 3 domain-containing protein n=1 Tax=Eruca vesicaria subsp. sativa TaxID=29727 RepID=A0ABC8J2A3_ERUVS|nr:unnamed protein product [Eruca vesicaria subsp. sativa]
MRGPAPPPPSEETADLLVSFDLVTEVFKFVKLPDDLLTDFDGQPGDRLVTFNNQLAIAQDDGDSNLLTLWLLDDKCSWFKREIIIPWTCSSPSARIRHKFIGTGATNELIYAPYSTYNFRSQFHFENQYVIYYDCIRETKTNVSIRDDFAGFSGKIEPYLDYTDSTDLISVGRPM